MEFFTLTKYKNFISLYKREIFLSGIRFVSGDAFLSGKHV